MTPIQCRIQGQIKWHQSVNPFTEWKRNLGLLRNGFSQKKRIKMRGKIKFTTKIRSIAGTIVKYIFKNYNMI